MIGHADRYSHVSRWIGSLILVVTASWTAQCWAVARDNADVYTKQETWSETMAATRRAYLQQSPAQAAQKASLARIWKAMRSDFPGPSDRFARDLRRRYLDWFGPRPDAKLEQSIVRQALPDTKWSGGVLRAELAALIREKAPAGDARWLALYDRAGHAAQVCGLLERIWLVDLQQSLRGQLTDLLRSQASPGDRRWTDLQDKVARIANVVPPGRVTDIGQMRPAIDSLSAALGGRFSAPEELLARLDQLLPGWRQASQSAAAGEQGSLTRLATACTEIEQFERSLVRSVDGMAEFLDAPGHQSLEAEWRSQYESLLYDLKNRSHFQQVAPQVYRTAALVADEDRDPADVVLRRTGALLADLMRDSRRPRLVDLGRQLTQLRNANASLAEANVIARQVLFAVACRLRRQIAFCNPLLDFDQILFIKKHRALFNHMCDQYYGMAATPGGGLFVLTQPFSSNPTVRDVLAQSVVAAPSRLAGQKLDGGSGGRPQVSFDGQGNRHGTEGDGGTFLSPDLSYDGQRVLFAYVENKGDMNHHHHVDPSRGHWDPGRCYHIFSVNVDGSDLRQLTDGTWNDFDPAWLPNGRVAFISERRGGYLRCGRVCPTYTLYDMAADGSDITCLSFHETNEWHPSVTNDGMILWTRWDYVDRHGCTAHMPWTTTLDGRDPRPVHGNYAPRRSRPDMEVDCRAIPGSRKFIATAAPHHGQAYGSLILIDPDVPDDDGMGPVRRITPEVGFPESQGGGQVYGTPWPLSEDYYLCVRDAGMQPGAGRQGGKILPGNYGIYLVDCFGNWELLYRDPNIGCLSPIPVRPRPTPPVMTELAKRGRGTNPAMRSVPADTSDEPSGTVAVVNIYDSQVPWPSGTRITALRVLQLFPMTVPSGRPPHETGLRVASAGDSVVPVRHVLGTVPVEEDGSVYFRVPANKELFFQALDENGLAVQSMRSATQVREGESLACAGCHNPSARAAEPVSYIPLALRREPSTLTPDVDGSRPFSYPRLVQPVLDRHCVECHAQHADKAPNLGREPIARHWYASYNSLIGRFGFHDYQDGYRTTPGQFGARASNLYKLLKDGHYDVQLTGEELHRITLWLDCTSMFYGVYEKQGGEAQLRGEIAYPTLE